MKKKKKKKPEPERRKRVYGLDLDAEPIPGGAAEVYRILDATGVSFEALAKRLRISPETLLAWMGTGITRSRYNAITDAITRITRKQRAG